MRTVSTGRIAAQGRAQPLGPFGEPEQEVEVALDRGLDPRAQDLDRDLLALGGDGEMHLRDRGRGHRPRPRTRRTARPAAARARPRPRALASADGNEGSRSCSSDRSRAIASPSRSPRTASDWPSLMKAGPSSCSARASRSPGRPWARRGWRMRSASQRTAARHRQQVQREQRVVPGEAARGREHPRAVAELAQHQRGFGRWSSQAPAGVDRGDPAGQVALAHLLEARRLASGPRTPPGRGSGGCSRPGSGSWPRPGPRSARAAARR